ncbi:unnamed protein product [Pseudo-nitzschia multistriata]|uniref:Uncharacterized protein n=1 Tax=Pseudo-nitzschia multistriata TaxID=183589 RepID=A0A448Z3V9_9STRA|nr:unnamed protein product [Pseudo-nitzschia multistriata]
MGLGPRNHTNKTSVVPMTAVTTAACANTEDAAAMDEIDIISSFFLSLPDNCALACASVSKMNKGATNSAPYQGKQSSGPTGATSGKAKCHQQKISARDAKNDWNKKQMKPKGQRIPWAWILSFSSSSQNHAKSSAMKSAAKSKATAAANATAHQRTVKHSPSSERLQKKLEKIYNREKKRNLAKKKRGWPPIWKRDNNNGTRSGDIDCSFLVDSYGFEACHIEV